MYSNYSNVRRQTNSQSQQAKALHLSRLCRIVRWELGLVYWWKAWGHGPLVALP